jgi:hypothetical protein
MLLALLPGQAIAADKETALMLTAPVRASVGDEITLTATLSRVRSNEKAKYLSDQVVRFVVDGVEVGSAVTNSTDENQNKDELSGQATLTYKVALEPGRHTIWAYFDGDDKYEPAETFATIRVKLPEQEWTYFKSPRVSPSYVRVGQPVQMTTILLDSHYKPIVGHTVIFQVDKAEVGRVLTDETGMAVFTYIAEAPGSHPVTIISEADAQYAESQMYSVLKVAK